MYVCTSVMSLVQVSKQVIKTSIKAKTNQKKGSKDDVHTTMTKTHRGELVLSDLSQDRIYGFVPNGYAHRTKITKIKSAYNCIKSEHIMSTRSLKPFYVMCLRQRNFKKNALSTTGLDLGTSCHVY